MSDSAGPEEWAEGDVADNHRYIDGHWQPIQAPVTPVPMRVPVGYAERFRRRWPWVVPFAVVLGVLWSWWANRPLTDPLPDHVSRGNAAVICVIAGLLMGLAIALIVTLVAALLPGSREAVDLPGAEQRRAQLGWIEDDEPWSED